MEARIGRRNITLFDIVGKPTVYATVILLMGITAYGHKEV